MRGRVWRVLGVALALLTVTAAGPTAAQDGRSPAGGAGQVVAHGVVEMPADELTWRLYDGEAGPLDDAEAFAVEWPGFLIGGDDPVLVDVDGDRSVLAGGKATLVREGDDLTVAAFDADDADYGWLTLTDSALDDGGAPALASDPFDAPSGDRQVDLARAVLDEGERAEVAQGAAGVFVVVLDGAAELRDDLDRESPEIIEAGDGGLYDDGDVTLIGEEDDTVVLAAVIGDRVPAGRSSDAPDPTAAPDEAVGAIEITVQTCAPGITVETISEQACPYAAPADESLQLLTFEGTQQIGARTVADLQPAQTGYVWTGLELRTHVLQVFASGGESVFVAETDQVVFIPGPQYEITLTEAAPTAFVPIYRLTEEIPAEDVSTVTLTFLGCEEGQDPEFFLPENCIEYVGGSAALANNDSGFYLGPDQAVLNDDGSLTWTYLGYDRFAPVDVVCPEGYVAYALSEPVVFTTPDAPDAYPYVYCFLPLEE